MKKVLIIIVSLAIVLIVGFYAFNSYIYNEKQADPSELSSDVRSFADCVRAGYSVMESYPRQCKTPDGRTYAEELPVPVTYENASADLIEVELPFPGAVTGKSFSVIGEARGTWYFEASFPIEVLDKDGASLAMGHAQAQGEWMTENFVPFKGDITVPESYLGPATLVLHKDNPSGLPEHDASLSFPITIEY
ncbi:MAG TPA: Gmad2 immunoglobulin-like domain-containing protein [Candidatus Paceibacterota bacterium]|nr:Gmad2 immunoglobulin-like domain-containing protein [Candidatus Paceibacterota bacterium]